MNGVITTCAGSFGRFGNAMFQYAVARAYAESIGAELRTLNWVGRDLFENVNDPIINHHFPRADGEILDGRTNIHLHGYFQRPEHVSLLSRKKLKEWFKPKPKYVKKGHDIVLHKRRGDYINNGYYAVVKDDSYLKAVKDFGYGDQKLTVYGDERPESCQYDDFFEISASRVIFRSNSTYSWWAAALSEARVFSPVVEDRTGWIDCDFVEGNNPKLMQLFGDLYIKE